MLVLQVILMVGGILLFALGYRKTKRNPMLLGAIRRLATDTAF